MHAQADLRDQWRRCGHKEPKTSASFLPPPPRGFVRAYHMTKFDHGITSVRDGRLKVTRISETNDPFELLGLNLHDKRLRRRLASFRESQNRRTGLLCFTSDWANPVLWSHYADQHKGICLGFDLKQGTYQGVQYEDHRLREHLSDEEEPDTVPEDIRRRLSRTKSSRWKYEQELRVLVPLTKARPDGDLFFWPFNENMRLAEVILGPRSDWRRLSGLRKLVAAKSPEAVAFKARLAFRSFGVVLNGKWKPKISTRARGPDREEKSLRRS
jgi:hypothetical protein